MNQENAVRYDGNLPLGLRDDGGHILSTPERIGLRLCFTHKENSERYESTKILSDMMVIFH